MLSVEFHSCCGELSLSGVLHQMRFEDTPGNEIVDEVMSALYAIIREKAWSKYGVAKVSEAHKRQLPFKGYHGSDEGHKLSQLLLVGGSGT